MGKSLILFLRNSVGLVFKPYITYREISVSQKGYQQVFFIHFLVLIYFLASSVLKTGLRNPFLLTLKFNSLYFSAYIGFFLMIGLLYLCAKLIRLKDYSVNKLILLWSYSLWPTLCWFFFTSLLYLLLPPPRSLTYLGKTYSLLYLVSSLTILFWKIILYYLTLRFGLRLELFRILLLSSIIFPSIAVFSIIMYRLSIFKIPFL